ncbi:golvesin C-terminal-like domain-containing protein [Phytohabitans suffuscus]|uniref:Golvesin/Xly CBD-like domain-containing protein n=1 Tax=Phytohabitans suffuscus TaxID=624315 RepID=A0A6F8YRP8_9ACTN|nr:hypothetical protein [Phytohabitans suffuscus]BCB88663.1 hypothetical protein Psuf_059760 [Phytohabitans suffuscus]
MPAGEWAQRSGLPAVALAATLVLLPAPGLAAPPPVVPPTVPAPGGPPTVSRSPDSVPADQRATVLGEGWSRSPDRAWVTSGDADGFHILVADAAKGYRWRTLATLAEPGLETDRWIGNACVTGSGRRVVVVYAPRTFTNRADLYDRGGFTAVVDVVTGAVTKLPVLTSLAYFNPACGTGEEAVLSQFNEGAERTRLLGLNTATAAITARIVVPGQLTAAVPTRHGIVAADRGMLVRVAADGSRRRLAPASGVPFKLAADAGGGVVYMDREGADRVVVRRTTVPAAPTGRGARDAVPQVISTGGLTELDVTSGRGGQVAVTGVRQSPVAGPRPAGVAVVPVPVGTRMSTHGQLAVTSVQEVAEPVEITAVATATGRAVSFGTTPDAGAYGGQGPNAGRQLSPAIAVAPGGSSIQADPDNPADFAERYCSVPRNDPRNQAMQPKPRQVEWAVDQAVRGVLTVSRPANWKNLGMPAYTPQGLFPPLALNGGGFMPAQVMLGVAAQESNLWQAARFAVPGVTANPLIGNYFGLEIYNSDPADDWTINWADADCGYGVTQVTDGMRLAGRTKPGETALPYDSQRAVALDFAANVAAGTRILQQKWNETRAAGLRINNGDAAKIENWFFAVWAYNSGYHPQSQAGAHNGAWGVGWANNPVNPRYPANRKAFLDTTYEDAAHPQYWPYPEKVMGWAGHPVEVLESPNNLVAGFRPAWWNGDAVTGPLNRTNVKPPVTQFCDASNDCVPGASYLPTDPDVIGEPAGPCAHRNAAGQFDLKCWYHQPSTWKSDCNFSCGNELLRFDPGYAYQEDGTAYPPRCTLDGLPGNALIIDDVVDGTPSIRPNCGRPWSNAGTFTLTFRPDATGQYPGKIDTHQIGGGFGGHFWFTHTRTAADNGTKLEVQAKWRLGQTRNGPMKILVALPDHGAHTRLARYVVQTANGPRERVVRQPGEGNRWVSIGTFMFNGVPEVTVSSITPDGDGSEDIAIDAMAFVPVAGTFREESVEAVAVFDEDQDLDTAAPASWLAGPLANRQSLHDWGHSKTGDILALPACPAAGDCIPTTVRAFAQRWRTQIVTAGTDPVNHPDGQSIARWIGFAQPYTDRPTGTQRPAHFSNDDHFKIRTKATVSFVFDGSGHIVPGSEFGVFEHRTGNTHLPDFVMDMFTTIQTAYGIPKPDLDYRIKDLNAHDGAWTSVDPLASGKLPGRAYAYAGKAPVPVDSAGVPSETNAVCVTSLFVAGGSIGYRPMLGEDGPSEAMTGYVDDLSADPDVPDAVRDLANGVREMFFSNGYFAGVNASLFTQAAPIWQELHFRACADGTIRENNRPILRASWMPDQYLYHNGQAMSLTGGNSGSSAPVWRGDFRNFSALPDPNQTFPLWPNPWGPCDSATDRSGNPWDMSPLPWPDDPGVNPDDASFCLDRSIPRDPSHSS